MSSGGPRRPDDQRVGDSCAARSASGLLDPTALTAFYVVSFGLQWFWRGRKQHRLEPYAWMVGLLCLSIAAHTCHRYRSSGLPVFMTIGAIYCSVLLLFALEDASDAAFVAYLRLSTNAAFISCLWAALGFTCGLEPGKLQHKLVLLTAMVSIMLLRLSVLFSAVPEIDPEVLTPLGIREEAATRVVSSLLFTNGLQAHIISPTVGFVVGLRVLHMITRLNDGNLRSVDYQEELKSVSNELAWMREHNAQLEGARREALAKPLGAAAVRQMQRHSKVRHRQPHGAHAWEGAPLLEECEETVSEF